MTGFTVLKDFMGCSLFLAALSTNVDASEQLLRSLYKIHNKLSNFEEKPYCKIIKLKLDSN